MSISKIKEILSTNFLERDEQIHGALCALLARQHVLLLGPPGTAKSQLPRAVCASIGGANYFEWLLTKTTTPEELFGPIGLKALKENRYARITAGKLPEAHIAFVDEIFKANSAILNTLLSVLAERVFHNNGVATDVPLQTCFAASNELPEGEELAALYDRFLLRYVVDYLREDGSFIALLGLTKTPIEPMMRLIDLAKAQADAAKIAVPDDVLAKILLIRKVLRAEGITLSDRRFKNALGLIKAAAYLDENKTVSEEDLLILKDTLWNQPAQRPIVTRTVVGICSPLEIKSLELYDQATAISHSAVAVEDQRQARCLEAETKLKRIMAELSSLESQSAKRQKAMGRIAARKRQIDLLVREVTKICLGV